MRKLSHLNPDDFAKNRVQSRKKEEKSSELPYRSIPYLAYEDCLLQKESEELVGDETDETEEADKTSGDE